MGDDVVGEIDGAVVGDASVGDTVGDVLGDCEGDAVGEVDGVWVGLRVGDVVGFIVGVAVVGTSVGDLVGASVKALHPPETDSKRACCSAVDVANPVRHVELSLSQPHANDVPPAITLPEHPAEHVR